MFSLLEEIEYYCKCPSKNRDCKCHPALEKRNKDDLDYMNLDDIYEPYFIQMRIPWFNELYIF